MKLTEQMHAAAAEIWAQCLDHPFVRGIGDGTLDMEKFRFFMLQDYLYLFDYARVFALGVVKARDPVLMREFARNVEATLNGEMNLHRAYMQRLGIREEDVLQVTPALANLSYTHYMLAIAEAGGPAEIVAAILACSWSYAEIGSALGSVPGAAAHPFYGEWITGYTSEEYQRTNEALIRLMDDLAESADAAERARLTEIFVNCSRYELAFWDMAWEQQL
ncbi:MAG: thiaminase II [Clostridia bacterium]|nr:thiaminase II [Clostridia bacterium]